MKKKKRLSKKETMSAKIVKAMKDPEVNRLVSLEVIREVPTDPKPEESKTLKPASEVKPIETVQDYVAYFKELFDPKNMIKKVTLLPPAMMMESGVAVYDDPALGKVKNARMKAMSWLKTDANGRPTKQIDCGTGKVMRESWANINGEVAERLAVNKEITQRESFDDVSDWALTGQNVLKKDLPFPPGPFTKQMYLQDFWKMLALCIQTYNYSGPAKRVIDLKADFILGNGVKVVFQDDDNLQAGWDEFEDRVGFYSIHRRWIIQFRKYGEQFIQPLISDYAEPINVPQTKPKVPKEHSGTVGDSDQAPVSMPVTKKLDVRGIDNATIWDYVTNPEDIYEIYGYWMQYTTQYQLYTKGTEGPEQAYTEYIMRMMPPDSLIFMKTNCDENEKRGRSDLLAALPYFAYNDTYIHSLVQRAILESNFVWDVEIQTGDSTDVAAEAAKEKNYPPSGSSYFHNSAVKRQLIAFNGAAASGSNQRGEEIVTQISMATGVPKEFLGESGHQNKAAALTATAPFTKHIQTCQKEDEVMMRKLVRFWTAANGRPNAKFEVIYPEIAPADMLQKIQALVLAETSEYYSKSRAATMVAKEFNDTTYDYETEKELINKQKEEQAQNQDNSMYPNPHQPGQPLPGQPPQAPIPPKPPGAGIAPSSPGEKTIGPPGMSDALKGAGIGQ